MRTARLLLEPLAVDHAAEMLDVLASPTLYEHIGGEPPTLAELEERFARLAAGSPDPAVQWRNWVVRRARDREAVGWLQATLTDASQRRAELAWVVGASHQGQGLATEAARWLLDEVARLGAAVAVASISSANEASAAVARRLGMTSDGASTPDGEVLWARELATRAGRAG